MVDLSIAMWKFTSGYLHYPFNKDNDHENHWVNRGTLFSDTPIYLWGNKQYIIIYIYRCENPNYIPPLTIMIPTKPQTYHSLTIIGYPNVASTGTRVPSLIPVPGISSFASVTFQRIPTPTSARRAASWAATLAKPAWTPAWTETSHSFWWGNLAAGYRTWPILQMII